MVAFKYGDHRIYLCLHYQATGTCQDFQFIDVFKVLGSWSYFVHINTGATVLWCVGRKGNHVKAVGTCDLCMRLMTLYLIIRLGKG